MRWKKRKFSSIQRCLIYKNCRNWAIVSEEVSRISYSKAEEKNASDVRRVCSVSQEKRIVTCYGLYVSEIQSFPCWVELKYDNDLHLLFPKGNMKQLICHDHRSWVFIFESTLLDQGPVNLGHRFNSYLDLINNIIFNIQ